MKKNLWLLVCLSLFYSANAQSKLDYWKKCYELGNKTVSYETLETEELNYFMLYFAAASNVRFYKKKNFMSSYVRCEMNGYEYSLKICRESWGDGIYTAFHIHNSDLFKRKIVAGRADWSVVSETLTLQNIQRYLSDKSVNINKVDVFEFGSHYWGDSMGFSKGDPTAINYRYGVYDGRYLYCFDVNGNVVKYEDDKDYHW
ncbi:MAG: hypothetical protein EAZ55_08765 [Cytophagales bacterium]|nr:MAG: hypothetical protein EAZ55_08765 [Cytophagales bacterium]